jgi:hypothetical protein
MSIGRQSGFDTYIDGLYPIVDQLIRSYQGNAGEHFSNTIMDIKHMWVEDLESEFLAF